MSLIHSNNTDNFITARSLTGLRRLMRKLDIKFNVKHIFVDRTVYTDKDGNTIFIAWYEPTTKETFKEVDEALNGNQGQ